MLNQLASVTPALFKSTDNHLLAQSLSAIGYACSPSAYLSLCFAVAVSSIIPLIFLTAALQLPVVFSLIAPVIFVFLLYFPIIEKDKLEKSMDVELPLLAYLARCDLLHSTPEKVVRSMHVGSFSRQRGDINQLLHNGLPLNLLDKAIRAPVKFKHTLRLVTSGDESGLKKLCRDLLEEQRNDAKRYAAKANIAGMFFISIAAVLPAFFSAIVLLGNLMGFSFTSFQVAFAFIVLFPFLDFAFLYYLGVASPVA